MPAIQSYSMNLRITVGSEWLAAFLSTLLLLPAIQALLVNHSVRNGLAPLIWGNVALVVFSISGIGAFLQFRAKCQVWGFVLIAVQLVSAGANLMTMPSILSGAAPLQLSEPSRAMVG